MNELQPFLEIDMNCRMHRFPSIIVILAVCLLVPLALPDPALAGNLSAELNAGLSLPGDNLNPRFDAEFFTSVLLEYSYNPYFSWFTTLGFTKFDRKQYPVDTDFAIYHLALDGALSYPILPALRASAFGGMGLYLWQSDRAWWVDGRSKDSGDVGFNYGFSLDYRFYSAWSVVSRIMYHSVRIEDSSSYFRWADAMLGIRYTF